jgi:hypothetical protein
MADTYRIVADYSYISDPTGHGYDLELVYHGMVVYSPENKVERIFKTVPEDAEKDRADSHSFLLGCTKGATEERSVRDYMLLAKTKPAERNQLIVEGRVIPPNRS